MARGHHLALGSGCTATPCTGARPKRPANAILAAAHYRYEPRPVAVARGNEKGRVERAIRYVRDSFFCARAFSDLDDLNAQARHWCEGEASQRRWPQDHARSVREAFQAERPSLLSLPGHDFPVGERVAVAVGKTPYARFDRNDYSVPHTQVRRTLCVIADEHRVRILEGTEELACHVRSWDHGAQIEDAAHLQALVERSREATGAPPPVALVLPAHVARRDAPVRAHDLASYDPPETPDDGHHDAV